MARLRRASGVREHDLVARARVLRESVDPLLPRLAGDAPKDRFDRLRAELEAAAGDGVDVIRDRLLGAVAAWAGAIDDDRSVLVARYVGGPS